MARTPRSLKIGDTVLVPWGVEEEVKGTIVDVWGDPPTQVRVELHFEDDPEPVILLLSPSTLKAA